jgi:hypothetical protein
MEYLSQAMDWDKSGSISRMLKEGCIQWSMRLNSDDEESTNGSDVLLEPAQFVDWWLTTD